ncbi:MAG: GNAT family N-acetyltransferase [Euryarchaeota archaeon]|jgi:GNAT superfamily N-acetyltransferase|nr:GNAT family N-acetyltransferase [Euryarchaeota archaeon]
MSYFKIKELLKEHVHSYQVKKFLFNMIQDEFGYGYIPEYHQDIVDLESYYLEPQRNNFFLAVHHTPGMVMGTMGIRAYDKDFPQFKERYHPETTASLWRVFVDRPWRRNGVASALVQMAEDFCRENHYEKIYLHTHKNVQGSLDFWLKNGYQVVADTGNHLKTVHMEKIL